MSNNLNQGVVPGMIIPTQKAMLAGTPRDSAQASLTASNESQANANKLMAGGKIKRKGKKSKIAGSNIVVPQYNMLYTPQGGEGTNPNNQIQSNAQTSTQMAANNIYDNYASIKGGTKKKKNKKTYKYKKCKKSKKKCKYRR